MGTVICPKCGEPATVRVEVSGGEECVCDMCEAEYTIDEVRRMIASWGPFLAWLDLHPARKAAA